MEDQEKGNQKHQKATTSTHNEMPHGRWLFW